MSPRFHTVMLEPTNHCNFKCPFCPSTDITRSQGYMDPVLAERVLAEIARRGLAGGVQFGVMGEPLLHRELGRMLAAAAASGLPATVFTNGSRFTEQNTAMLLTSRLDRLCISYRAVEETGFKDNSGLRFEQYRDGIKRFLARAGDSGNIRSIYLKVFQRTLVGKAAGTDSQARRLHADETAAFLENFFDFLPGRARLSGSSLTANRDLHVAGNIHVRFETIARWNSTNTAPGFRRGLVGACDGVSGHIAVLWNGDVTTCCKDYDGNNAFGSLDSADLAAILDSTRFRSLERSLRLCILPTDYCRICRGGQGIFGSALHQLGSIVVYKLPLVRRLVFRA